jgi:predicted nucleic acid-binding protein
MVKQLTLYQDDVSKIPHMHLTILSPTLDIVQASVEVRKREELLTNDSFVVAFMREQGLTQLATANGDFDRVGGIAIYKPTDLERQDTPDNLSV